MHIKDAIKKLVCFKDLTEAESYSVFSEIMNGTIAPTQIAAFLTALRMKGEQVDEITGAAKSMRKLAVKLTLNSRLKGEKMLDTCGTGGDGAKTFNISTCAALVTAACGVKVAKHGNRAVTSECGSADVLEKLGVRINVPKKLVEACIDTIGVGFLFAPLFHRAMANARAVREEIGIRTIFNILGPLCNPASLRYQLIGVFNEELTDSFAKVLQKLGSRHAYIVHGAGPIDEVSTIGKTKISELKNKRITSYYVSPSDFGVKKASLRDIKGSSSAENAEIIRHILRGEKGPMRDIVLVNSSVALMAVGKVKGFKEGLSAARHAIDSGRAMEKLEALVRMTNA